VRKIVRFSLLLLLVVNLGALAVFGSWALRAKRAAEDAERRSAPPAASPIAMSDAAESVARGLPNVEETRIASVPDVAPAPAAEPPPPPLPIATTDVRGRVVDVTSGLPLEDTEVRALEIATARQHLARSTRGGRFEFLALRSGQLVEFTARRDDHAFVGSPIARVLGSAGVEPEIELRMRPTVDLSGVVRGDDGKGVTATLVARRGTRVLETEADAAGRFRFVDFARVFGASARSGAARVTIIVRNDSHQDATREVTLDALTLASPLEITLLRGASVEGVIRDAHGEPLPGVDVTIFALDADDAAPRAVTSDRSGHFTLAGLAPGTWRVTPIVVSEGLSPKPSHRDFELAPLAHVVGADFQYLPGAPIAGRAVHFEGEIPLRDRIVLLGHESWLEPLVLLTDHRGEFRCASLPEGEYDLTLLGEDFDDGRAAIALDGVPSGTEDVLFVVDEEPRDGSLRLRLVEQGSGRPLPHGARVTVRLGFVAEDVTQRRTGAYTVGRDGVVVISRLARTTHRGEVKAPGFAAERFSFDAGGDGVESRVDLALPIGVSVSGSVIDARGLPVPDARIALFHREDATALLFDGDGELVEPDGSFVLEDVPPDGAHLIAAADDARLAPVRVPLHPGGGAIHGMKIVLREGRRIEGVVRLRDAPLAWRRIRLAGEVAMHESFTDATGRFAFTAVEPGEFMLLDEADEPFYAGPGEGDALALDIVLE
jgi:hypothetical protein